MITNFLLDLVVIIFAGLLSWMPVVTLASIPVVGGFISNTLQMAVGYFNSAMITLPYLQVVWHMFLWVVLPFELALLILKFFLGNHMPANIQ